MKALAISSCLFATLLTFISATPVRSHNPLTKNATNATHRLLEEMLRTLDSFNNSLTSTKNPMIPKVMDGKNCKAEDFCKVQKVLSNVSHSGLGEKGKLIRQLTEYNKHYKGRCHVEPHTEIPLSDVLRHLRSCIQKNSFNRH
ncbi:hypothetical protein GJAV_G00134830 [Gymnothorax javanicus]|nr:hypothetical protein GJAV_G00134830 [Gymnothorax javanicus]